MSQQNVELVRRVYEAAARRDSATVFDLYAPDVVLDPSRLPMVTLGTAPAYVGHDGVREFFRHWHEAWQRVEYDYDELVDMPGEHVVSVVTRRGRGRASGAEVELAFALVWTIREGKVSRVDWYLSREEALLAAGGDG